MLSTQVKAGKLPPVEMRLPTNPMVIQPEENIGMYGGTWHMTMTYDDRNFTYRTIGYEPLVRWDSQWTRVIPNVAQSYEANETGTDYTFHLRKGMRWSDGEPFTADDILFWYKAVFSNKELTPSPASWLVIGGKPVTVEKTDDYIVVFHFAAPYGLFLQRLATPDSNVITNYPRHYYARFHKDYNPNIDDLVAKAGVKTWVELFQKQAPYDLFNLNWESPTLNAWIYTSDYFAERKLLRAVRNPYYWKIDPDFNQLPYIDYVEFAIVKDNAAITASGIAGQIDMQNRNLGTGISDPANMQKGDYRLFRTLSTNSTSLTISLNMTSTDPVKRAIFQNHDFRAALSYAINRSKINSQEPYQAAPIPESPLYNAQLAKQYTEYDVSKANDLLDKAGFAKRDSDNYRLGPDGKRISFKITSSDSTGAESALKLIQVDWKAVGIDMSYEVLKRADAEALYFSNKFDAGTWGGDGGFEVILEPRYYFPYSRRSLFAPLWAKWFINPKDPEAEEPPAIVKKQIDLYNQLQATVSPDEQIELMKQIISIAADQFYVIGITRPPLGTGIVKNNFHNVPALMPNASLYPNPAPTNPCQYYIDPLPAAN